MNDGFEDALLGEVPNIMRVNALKVDDHRWIVVSVLCNHISDVVWKHVKNIIMQQLKYIYEHRIMYHFVFDVHEIPISRLPSFQRLMRRHQHVFDRCLYSTAVVTQNKMLHSVIKLALELYDAAQRNKTRFGTLHTCASHRVHVPGLH